MKCVMEGSNAAVDIPREKQSCSISASVVYLHDRAEMLGIIEFYP